MKALIWCCLMIGAFGVAFVIITISADTAEEIRAIGSTYIPATNSNKVKTVEPVEYRQVAVVAASGDGDDWLPEYRLRTDFTKEEADRMTQPVNHPPKGWHCIFCYHPRTENMEKFSREFKKVEVAINNHAEQITAAERVLKLIVKVLGIGNPPTVGGH